MYKLFKEEVTKLETDQQKRLPLQFETDEITKVEKLIRENTKYLTRKIKETEELIKQISYLQVDSNSEDLSKIQVKKS